MNKINYELLKIYHAKLSDMIYGLQKSNIKNEKELTSLIECLETAQEKLTNLIED